MFCTSFGLAHVAGDDIWIIAGGPQLVGQAQSIFAIAAVGIVPIVQPDACFRSCEAFEDGGADAA